MVDNGLASGESDEIDEGNHGELVTLKILYGFVDQGCDNVGECWNYGKS